MNVTGRWRIVEMDLWDLEAIDLQEPAFIEFRTDRTGQFRFIAVEGWMVAPTASATGARLPTSPERVTTKGIGPAVVVGRCWSRTVRCADTSTSTSVTPQASVPSAPKAADNGSGTAHMIDGLLRQRSGPRWSDSGAGAPMDEIGTPGWPRRTESCLVCCGLP